MLDGSLGSGELAAVRGCLTGGLLLREPVNRGLVQEVQDSCDCSTSGQVVAQVGVLVRCGDHRFALGCGRVGRLLLLHIAIDCACPVTFLGRKVRIIWLFRADANEGRAEFG